MGLTQVERNRRERQVLIMAALLVPWILIVANDQARTLYVLADPNCTQIDFERTRIDFAYDPNQIVGSLLPPVERPAGKFNWFGHVCDAEGDPVLITLQAAPAGLTLDVNDAGAVVTLAGELGPGLHAVVFHMVDVPPAGVARPAERNVTLLVRVAERANTPPVLY
jgi:hypothetical protein